jgi:cation transport ATPase
MTEAPKSPQGSAADRKRRVWFYVGVIAAGAVAIWFLTGGGSWVAFAIYITVMLSVIGGASVITYRYVRRADERFRRRFPPRRSSDSQQ